MWGVHGASMAILVLKTFSAATEGDYFFAPAKLHGTSRDLLIGCRSGVVSELPLMPNIDLEPGKPVRSRLRRSRRCWRRWLPG